jgi:hypothetical protein
VFALCRNPPRLDIVLFLTVLLIAAADVRSLNAPGPASQPAPAVPANP